MNNALVKQLVLFFTFLITLLSQSSFAASYQCPKTAPAAYTGDLNVSSKYDPADPTRSTEIAVDSASRNIQKQLNRFSTGIVFFSDYYVNYRKDRRGQLALDCLHNWLSSWASESAMTTTNPSYTGKALRSWTLSSVSSSLLKVRYFAGNNWTLTPTESAWLNQLAERVMQDYSGRIENIPNRVNNHDYWGAWAVTATGTITGHRDFSDWGYIVFNHAMQQAVTDSRTDTAYLPNELGRGQLGVHYSHFAITPLVMLSEQLPKMGYSIHYQDQNTLSDLASFASLSILRPELLAHLTPYSQQTPSPGILSWSIPFTYSHPEHSLARQLLNTYEDVINGHNQIGGKIKPMYSSDPV